MSNFDPLAPVDRVLSPAEVHAIKAVYAGAATPEQQQLCLYAIVTQIAQTFDLGWYADNDRLSAFASGKRCVGSQILTVCKVPYNKLMGLPEQKTDSAAQTAPRRSRKRARNV